MFSRARARARKHHIILQKNKAFFNRGGFEPKSATRNPFKIKVFSVFSPIVRQIKILQFIDTFSSKWAKLIPPIHFRFCFLYNRKYYNQS